jgi:cytochrome P450
VSAATYDVDLFTDDVLADPDDHYRALREAGPVAPSLDTTISAIGHAVWLSAAPCQQWRLLREDPARVKHAFHDITRESAAHVAFGYGIHACADMGLARLDGGVILTALVERVETIEFVDSPEWKLNTLIRAFRSLPVRVTPG